MNTNLLIASFSYTVFGVSILAYNKWIIFYYGFTFPIFLIWLHMGANTFFSIIILIIIRKKVEDSEFWPRHITFKVYFRNILPLALLSSFDIALTNISFAYISVSMVEIIKSGIPALVLLFDFISGRRKLSIIESFLFFLLWFSISLTVFSEYTLNITGIITCFIAMFFGGFKLILLEYLIIDKGIHYILSLFYFSSLGFLILIPFFLLQENPFLIFTKLTSGNNIILLLFTSMIMAFGLNVSEFCVVSYSSALNLCVISILKLIIAIVLTSFLFHIPLSFLNCVGITLTIFGVILHNYLKYNKNDSEKSKNNMIELEEQSNLL